MKTTNPFLEIAFQKAKKNPQMIVFPEAEKDERTLEAVIQIAKQGIAYPILLGDPKILGPKTKNLNNIQIVDYTQDSPQKQYYATKLFELRKDKGMTLEKAQELMNDINYYGIMMLQEDHANGLISGATVPTADTVRPAFEIIKTKEKFHKVSGFFFMLLEKRVLLFADCAINIDPTAEELAEIGLDTARTALKFGIDPKVAFLSFSTNGSSDDPITTKVKEATRIAKLKAPELLIEGEMQVDSAIDKKVASIKCPKSQIAGEANILIFPNLACGNIAYKLVERLAKAKAIGPILQGLNKPVNDLSRGCSVEDIVNLAAITSVEAQQEFYNK